MDILFGDGKGNFGDGKGSTTATTTPLLVGNIFDGPIAAGDFNGAGRDNLAIAADSLSALRITTLKADLTPQQLAFIDLGASPNDIAIADLDRDGKLDIVTANTSNASILINTTLITKLSSALNGASFATTQPLPPGSLASLFGSGLALQNAQASAIPIPVSLGGVSMTIGGVPAPILFVSAKQINFQVPWTVPAGNADILVTVNGMAAPALRVIIGAASPGIFSTQSGTGQAIAINADGSLTAPEGSLPGVATHPAKPGDTIIVLATGLGVVTPTIATGAASTDALRNTTVKPGVMVGGVPAEVSFSGLSPQFVGVNQLNVVIPGVGPGVVSLQLDENGIRSTDKVTIAIAAP